MATVVLNRFSNPDTLKRIGDGFLIELLSPYSAFLAGRGLALPATAEAEPIDYEKLADTRRDGRQYALRRGLGFWELTYEGRQTVFKHELGALYVACLLLEPPREPIHAVALALRAREMCGQAAGPCELVQQRSLGLDDAAEVRALWRRQRTLEQVLEDDDAIEAVKAEALRELEEVSEFLRKSPWRSRGGAERCVEAVGKAIRRLYGHLCAAMDGAGMAHPVLQAFGRHLHEYVLIPSGRGGGRGGARLASAPGGCFTYEPPPGVVWAAGTTGARLSSGAAASE